MKNVVENISAQKFLIKTCELVVCWRMQGIRWGRKWNRKKEAKNPNKKNPSNKTRALTKSTRNRLAAFYFEYCQL